MAGIDSRSQDLAEYNGEVGGDKKVEGHGGHKRENDTSIKSQKEIEGSIKLPKAT